MKEIITGARSVDLAPTLEDMEFTQCTFARCRLGTDHDPTHRAVVRNITLKNCQVTGSDISGAVIKDCTVDGLKASGLYIVYGCAYEHVTLKGRIGRLWLRGFPPRIGPAGTAPDWRLSQAYEAANAAFYRHIDWALDIREAIVRELTIDGLPAHLIRRDPERHVAFRRSAAVEGRWRELDLRHTAGLGVMLERLAVSELESQVFVVPDQDAERESTLLAVKLLRDVGIAEPD